MGRGQCPGSSAIEGEIPGVHLAANSELLEVSKECRLMIMGGSWDV